MQFSIVLLIYARSQETNITFSKHQNSQRSNFSIKTLSSNIFNHLTSYSDKNDFEKELSLGSEKPTLSSIQALTFDKAALCLRKKREVKVTSIPGLCSKEIKLFYKDL